MPITSKSTKYVQTILIFWQSGEISPNLVTLTATVTRKLKKIFREENVEITAGARSSVHGFESRRSILNRHDIFHIDLLLKLYCLVKKTKNKQKEAGVGPFFKKMWKCITEHICGR